MANSLLAQSLTPPSISQLQIDNSQLNALSKADRVQNIQAVYTQLFKANRDLVHHHDDRLESLYLNGQLTTRQFIIELLNSDMFVNYIFATNSNFRFVELCFERVLGRKGAKSEIYKWSSLLASQGLPAFSEQLVNSDEYSAAFGDNLVPFRRSRYISSSNQGLPALPKELSEKRYQRSDLMGLPPELIRKAGAVVTVAGVIELVRIVATVAWEALHTGI